MCKDTHGRLQLQRKVLIAMSANLLFSRRYKVARAPKNTSFQGALHRTFKDHISQRRNDDHRG